MRALRRAMRKRVTASVLFTINAEGAINTEWASVMDHTYPDGLETNSGSLTFPTPSTTDGRGTLPSRLGWDTSVQYSGTRCYKARVQDGDSAFGERCEFGTGNPYRLDWSPDRLFREGEVRFVAFALRFGTGMPLNPTDWYVVMQFKQLGSLGTPILGLSPFGGGLVWVLSASNGATEAAGTTIGTLSGVTLNTWIPMLMEFKFSPDNTVGYVRCLADSRDGNGVRQMIPKTYCWTQKISDGSPGVIAPVGTVVPTHIRWGHYRNSTNSGTADIYFDALACATTQAAAANAAFDATDAAAFATA